MKKFTFPTGLITTLAFLYGCKQPSPQPPAKGAAPATVSTESDKSPNHASSSTTLKFVDDISSHQGLVKFRSELEKSIKDGNQDRILAAFSEIIEFDPGHSKGETGVKEIWKLDGSKERLAPLGAILSDLLSRGGCIKVEEGVDTTLTAPFTNCIPSSETGKCGESGCGVVSQAGADLYATPDLNSKPFDRLEPLEIIPSSADTVCTEDFKSCEWTRISTLDGKTGFITRRNLSTEQDGLLWMVKETGEWRIRVLKSPGIPWDDT